MGETDVKCQDFAYTTIIQQYVKIHARLNALRVNGNVLLKQTITDAICQVLAPPMEVNVQRPKMVLVQNLKKSVLTNGRPRNVTKRRRNVTKNKTFAITVIKLVECVR